MIRPLAFVGLGLVLAAAAAAVLLAGARSEPAQALTNCSTDGAALNTAEQNVVDLLNAYRAQNGVGPLKVSPGLSRAAAFMSEDMLAKGYFDHFEQPSGRSPFQRAVDCGFPSNNIGENLAKAFSGASAIALWKTSPLHNANMLKSNWKMVGVGQAGGYWTLDLGVVDDSGGPAGQPSPTVSSPTPTPTPTATPTPTPTPPNLRTLVPMLATE